MPENCFLTPRTIFKGETSLQVTALQALRSECKYPHLFDSAINEMCSTLVGQLEGKHSEFVKNLIERLGLEGEACETSVLMEVSQLVADIQKLVVDEEQALQKAEQDLCARFLALMALRVHEPEDFTPERVDEDIRALKKDREVLYAFRADTADIAGYNTSGRLPDFDEWKRMVTEALVGFKAIISLKKDPASLYPDQRAYSDVFEFFKELIKERDALREENEKLIEADREFRNALSELFHKEFDPELASANMLCQAVEARIDENESLKKDLEAAKAQIEAFERVGQGGEKPPAPVVIVAKVEPKKPAPAPGRPKKAEAPPRVSLPSWNYVTSPEIMVEYVRVRANGMDHARACREANVEPAERTTVSANMATTVQRAKEYSGVEREEYLANLLERWRVRASIRRAA